MIARQAWTRLIPPATGNFVVGGMGYFGVAKGVSTEVRSEHVEALLAQGFRPAEDHLPGPTRPTGAEIQAQREAQRIANQLPIPLGEPLWRVIPPLAGPSRSLTVEGRPYLGSSSKPQDVPRCDGKVLTGNGWVLVGTIGTPEDRPARALKGDRRFEGKAELIFDGSGWRNVLTGAPA